MAKRKGDKLTLDKVKNMIEESVLSLDEESECSKDEDLSQSLATYLHRRRKICLFASNLFNKLPLKTQKKNNNFTF